MKENQPNYITQKSIKSNVCFLDDINQIKGSIVCIPNADPGYDWIFSHEIGGLITAWEVLILIWQYELVKLVTSSNRAGEILYKKWSSQRKLHINCRTLR